jgi:hypothetical protein
MRGSLVFQVVELDGMGKLMTNGVLEFIQSIVCEEEGVEVNPMHTTSIGAIVAFVLLGSKPYSLEGFYILRVCMRKLINSLSKFF